MITDGLLVCKADESAEIESYKTQRVDKFSKVGPGYYGELDEDDAELLAFERAAEAEGPSPLSLVVISEY